MKKSKILDCTLRDGAYLIDKNFGENNIRGIIHGLIEGNIDIIEIGFFQDEGFGDGKTVFLNSKEAKKYIPSNKQGKMFTVLADISRYSVSNLDEYDMQSVDAIRVCFFKHEKDQVVDFCKNVKEKGYKVFVQPVDIMGYTDQELLDLIYVINPLEPYCFSLVDTFGSMYLSDLTRIYDLVEHNLIDTSAIGFHSHNNMQMSNALAQHFLSILHTKRAGIVDTTISGMGRGAGNTPTELIVQYMTSQLEYDYNLDAILDVIDNYMEKIRLQCNWGYSTDFFIAGAYAAHVNNITYLNKKNSISSKDMRYIINELSLSERKRYDYNLLEKTYVGYLTADIDDSSSINFLRETLREKNIVVMAPGKSIYTEKDRIREYIKQNDAIVISINFLSEKIPSDFLYMSNKGRLDYCSKLAGFKEVEKIFTSNMDVETDEKVHVVSFTQLIKCGWVHVDNSALMLLRLLERLEPKKIGIAGLDGYSYDGMDNFFNEELDSQRICQEALELNSEISSMLTDFYKTRKNNIFKIEFITESRFQNCIEG